MSLIQYRPGGGTGIVGSAKGGGMVGPPGPPGPQGAGIVVSAFSSINGSSVTLTTSFLHIHSTTITTTAVGYIMGQVSIQIKNTDNKDHFVEFYMIVNGTTSSTIIEDIRKPSGTVDGYGNLFITQRSGQVPTGTYPIEVYGRTATALSAPDTLVVDHLNLSGLGNLA